MFLKVKRNNNHFPGDTLMSTTPLLTAPNLASQCQGGTSPSFEKVTFMGPSVFDPPHTLLLRGWSQPFSQTFCSTGQFWDIILSMIWLIPFRITPHQGGGSPWSLFLDPEEAFTPHWDSLNPHSIFLSLSVSFQEHIIILRYRRQHIWIHSKKRNIFLQATWSRRIFFSDHHEYSCASSAESDRFCLPLPDYAWGSADASEMTCWTKPSSLEGHTYAPRDPESRGLSTLAP